MKGAVRRLPNKPETAGPLLKTPPCARTCNLLEGKIAKNCQFCLGENVMRCCLYHKPFSLSNFSQLSQDRWRNKANETYNFFLKRQTTRDTYLNTNIMEGSLKLHKTQDCRWHQVTLEPKTARIGDFIFIFLFPYLRMWTIVILVLSLSLYFIYCKGNSEVQMGWGHNEAKNSKNWRLYPYILISIFISS